MNSCIWAILFLLCFKSKATGNEKNPLAGWFQPPIPPTPPLLYSPVDAQPCPHGPAWQGQRKWPSINGSFDYSPVTNVADMKDKKSRRMTSAPIRSTPTASTCSRDTFAEPFGAKTERHDNIMLKLHLVCMEVMIELREGSVLFCSYLSPSSSFWAAVRKNFVHFWERLF